MRTSTTVGAVGRPIRRESCCVVIRVVAGIASPSLFGIVDAIFQPQPHGVIADNPLPPMLACAPQLNKTPSSRIHAPRGKLVSHLDVSALGRTGPLLT